MLFPKSQCCWQEREVLLWDLWDRKTLKKKKTKTLSSALICQTLKSADLASACHKMGRGLTSTRKFMQEVAPTFASENRFALTPPANICILYASESQSCTAKHLEVHGWCCWQTTRRGPPHLPASSASHKPNPAQIMQKPWEGAAHQAINPSCPLSYLISSDINAPKHLYSCFTDHIHK